MSAWPTRSSAAPSAPQGAAEPPPEVLVHNGALELLRYGATGARWTSGIVVVNSM